MKNSTILNVLQKTKQTVKNQQNGGGNKNWIHSPEALLNNHVVYLVKFLGNTEVDQPKGTDVIREGIRKLKFNQQLKKAEGTKPTKVELTISVDGVTIQEPKTKRVMHKYPLHRISYCADDKLEKRFLSFIAKETEEGKHMCFVFVSDKLAEEITLTIGQAFDLAYRRFLENQGKDAESRKQVAQAQRRAQAAEAELAELRTRLRDVSGMVGREELEAYLRQKQISDILEVHIPEENLKNLQQNNYDGNGTGTGTGNNGDGSNTESNVINLISDFDPAPPSSSFSSSDDDFSPPPVPPRVLPPGPGSPPSPTTGDLLGEIDPQFHGHGLGIGGSTPVVGPKLENLNWSDLEDLEGNTNVNMNMNGHGVSQPAPGLANQGGMKLAPPPGSGSAAAVKAVPPPLPARNLPPNPLSDPFQSLSLHGSVSSPSLSNNNPNVNTNTNGVVNNPFGSFGSGSGGVGVGGKRDASDPFGMGEFGGAAHHHQQQQQQMMPTSGFGRPETNNKDPFIQSFDEFSLESLDPLRN